MTINTNLPAVKRRYGIIGRSEALERALSTAMRVAGTDLSILITGESGVGKEVFSRIIHDNSSRKHEGFIAINCGALPEGTINSELFGHVKGAFTSASNDRKGYFETYDGGTIFLDEIGEMPLETQAFLLRVLENGEFIRVGASAVQRTNVRVIAATNRKLQERMAEGKFREDLYYRLATVPIDLPSLRERPEDIYLLFRHFVNEFSEKQRIDPVHIDTEARSILENYHWPGNIRELKNVAEQLSVLAEKRELTALDLSQIMPRLLKRHLPSPASTSRQNSGRASLDEREILYKVLFEMKSDLNELKSLIFELIRSNDLSVPNMQRIRALQLPGEFPAAVAEMERYVSTERRNAATPSSRVEELLAVKDFSTPDHPLSNNTAVEEQPILLDRALRDAYEVSEVVEENLSLADNERELIKKALQKHDHRRKEAAAELGVSERTLYRKIKEYGL